MAMHREPEWWQNRTNAATDTTSDVITYADDCPAEIQARMERIIAFCLRAHGFGEAADLIESGDYVDKPGGDDHFDLPWPADDTL